MFGDIIRGIVKITSSYIWNIFIFSALPQYALNISPMPSNSQMNKSIYKAKDAIQFLACYQTQSQDNINFYQKSTWSYFLKEWRAARRGTWFKKGDIYPNLWNHSPNNSSQIWKTSFNYNFIIIFHSQSSVSDSSTGIDVLVSL